MPLFHAIVINALVCLGVHVLTREGMLLGSFAEYTRAVIGEFWCKPLFDCPPCMASVWGLIGWLYLNPAMQLIPYLLLLCGVNALINKLYYYE